MIVIVFCDDDCQPRGKRQGVPDCWRQRGCEVVIQRLGTIIISHNHHHLHHHHNYDIYDDDGKDFHIMVMVNCDDFQIDIDVDIDINNKVFTFATSPV